MPFDIAPDRYPYPDRTYYGIVYRPRVHIYDYLYNGEIVVDRRIIYIRYSEEDSDIVFLSSEGFSIDRIIDED